MLVRVGAVKFSVMYTGKLRNGEDWEHELTLNERRVFLVEWYMSSVSMAEHLEDVVYVTLSRR